MDNVILNSLTAQIAVLDNTGVIVTVNQSWRNFLIENGGDAGTDDVGKNYLEVCQNAFINNDDSFAKAALEGICKVISGELSTFKLEYPCHSPSRQRWFVMRVNPISGSKQGVVIAHEEITERKLMEETLRENEEKYQILFNNEIYAICIIDLETYRILDVNQTFLRLYGYSRSELMEELTASDLTVDQQFFIASIDQVKATRVSNTFVRHHRKKNGSIFPVELVVGSYLWQGRKVLYAIVDDISERVQAEEKVQKINQELEKRIEERTLNLKNANQILEEKIQKLEQTEKILSQSQEEIRKQAQRAEALVRTAAQFNARLDLKVVLNTICKEAVAALGASAADLLHYDQKTNQLMLVANYGFSPNYILCHQTEPFEVYQKLSSQLGADGIIPDIQTLPQLINADLYKSENIRTVMAASIFVEERFVGILDVFSYYEIRNFDDGDLSLLKALANQAAQAIHNAFLFEQITLGQERQKSLSRQLLEIQEAERRTLALELHDELGQLLNSVKLSLDMIPQFPPEIGKKQYAQASSLMGDLIERVRNISLELRPSLLDDLGLLATLNWLFENYQGRTNEPVKFNYSNLEREFSPDLKIVIYRIVQEALTNVIRHAENKKVFVDIWQDKTSVYLRIADHGGGFDVNQTLTKSKSTGLSGMRERARLLGGELLIESALGEGTTLTANLPLAFAAETKEPS